MYHASPWIGLKHIHHPCKTRFGRLTYGSPSHQKDNHIHGLVGPRSSPLVASRSLD